MHRVPGDRSEFGCNTLERARFIDGFELYSSQGLVGSIGPLRSAFYRMSITVTGELDMQIGPDQEVRGDRPDRPATVAAGPALVVDGGMA